MLDKIFDDVPSLLGLLIAIPVLGICLSVIAILIIRNVFGESWTEERRQDEEKKTSN